jgi:transcription antitermination factor NusG
MCWFVLCVKRNQEKNVANALLKMNVEVFCPFIKEIRNWSDRKKEVEIPLFKSYIFVNLGGMPRHIVFDIPGVKSYLFFEGKPAVVKNDEIDIIENWISTNSNNSELSSGIIPGSKITLKKGPMKNNEGVVQWVNKSNISILIDETEFLLKSKLTDII